MCNVRRAFCGYADLCAFSLSDSAKKKQHKKQRALTVLVSVCRHEVHQTYQSMDEKSQCEDVHLRARSFGAGHTVRGH